MTKLENLVLVHPRYRALGENADKKARQAVLDEIKEEVLAQLDSHEIRNHTSEVYNETVGEYAANPHTKGIIDECRR